MSELAINRLKQVLYALNDAGERCVMSSQYHIDEKTAEYGKKLQQAINES